LTFTKETNMKKLLLAALIAFGAVNAQAANVGVSINIGDPNFYGQIDIGNYPQPQLVSPSPVVIAPVVGVAPPPIYLHVPPDHYAHWARYCGQYNACGRQVYFVHDNWYRNVYAPRYRNEHAYHQEVRHEEHREQQEIRHEEHREHQEERHEEHREHEHGHDHD